MDPQRVSEKVTPKCAVFMGTPLWSINLCKGCPKLVLTLPRPCFGSILAITTVEHMDVECEKIKSNLIKRRLQRHTKMRIREGRCVQGVVQNSSRTALDKVFRNCETHN